MDRAYSTLVVKASTDDEGTFEGLASTPSFDTQSDIVEPPRRDVHATVAAVVAAPTRRNPIGQVTAARVTDAGIYVKARIQRITEPGKLKDRLDECWLSVKHGLVKGFSIGVHVIESAPLPVQAVANTLSRGRGANAHA